MTAERATKGGAVLVSDMLYLVVASRQTKGTSEQVDDRFG